MRPILSNKHQMEKLNCNYCFTKYTASNPPRLIPTCGHSFCENCLVQKLDPCDADNVYIICPLDAKQMLLQDKDINNFPKNISLLKELNISNQNIREDKNTGQNTLASSYVQQEKFRYNNIPSVKTISVTTTFEESSIKQGTIKSNENLSDQFFIHEEEICLVHQKRLEIVCTQDLSIICSNCAIFGDHKGHEFKSLEEVEKDKSKRYQEIINICDKKQLLCLKINQRQTKQQINRMFKLKKESLAIQIKDKYARLYDIMRVSEKKNLEKLNNCFKSIEDKLKNESKILESPLSQYKQWEVRAFKQIEIFQQKNNLGEQIQLLNYSKKNKEIDTLELGRMIIADIENANKAQLATSEEYLENINVEFNEQVEKKLSDYSNIIFKETKSGQMTPKQLYQSFLLKQNASVDEILIDQGSIKPKKSAQGLRNILKGTKQFTLFDTPVLTKFEATSPTNFRASLNQTKQPILFSSPKDVLKKKYKLKIPDKYERIVETILNDTTDILDLTNAELGDQNIMQILEILKNKKLRIIKLVRNKLTDDIANQIWPLIPNVTTLNLSQNVLSDKILDSLLANFKKIPNMKSIILSQNKIKERNIKNKLEEVRKLDVIVSL